MTISVPLGFTIPRLLEQNSFCVILFFCGLGSLVISIINYIIDYRFIRGIDGNLVKEILDSEIPFNGIDSLKTLLLKFPNLSGKLRLLVDVIYLSKELGEDV